MGNINLFFFIFSFIVYSFPYYPSYWIGLQDLQSEGNWVWNDGVPVNSNFPWGPGEPNNSNNGEHCGEIFIADDGIIGNDAVCSRASVEICQKSIF